MVNGLSPMIAGRFFNLGGFMNLHIKSTTKLVELNGVPARVWEGVTGVGVPVHCFITRIAVANASDQAVFERELEACDPPSADVAAYPTKLVL